MMNKFINTFLTTIVMHSALLSVESEINTIGHFHPSSKSAISSQVTGRIDQVFVEIGFLVKKGQAIVQLDSRPFEITVAQKKAALEASKIELVDAETNFARMQKLWEKPEGETPSIPLKRFEDSQTKYAQALVSVKQAEENLKKAKLDLEESTIKAPFEGIITKKMIDIGESLPSIPVTHVAEIQATDPLYLEFSIPTAYQAYVSEKSPISFEIDGLKIPNNSAKIHLFYPCLDEHTKSLRCRAIIDNAEGLIRPGTIARVSIKTSASESN